MNRIKEVLKDKGISQTWLADKMGKSYNTINEYARNKRQPSIEALFEIAEILNMEAKELIEKRDLKENK
ncbi:transcriptional regulator [Nonlabens ulvanivorans]|uniref:Transcriptional regulator n=1 Tax=Nonlabens ulvanivorans TaxID=906888 RepID=A0A084JX31_NONUL|nr:helix-turn-helix transcriptional regulator [Nonlabens ulvanivorans]KEZ93515.1 transcriptional regulator [Nonlabens ulvanivorans]